MKATPLPRDQWVARLLLPFKVYSVLGAIAFAVLNFGHDHFGWSTWQVCDVIGGRIMLGYLVSALVLVLGGSIQHFSSKRVTASSSFAFAAADLWVLLLLPAFFHA